MCLSVFPRHLQYANSLGITQVVWPSNLAYLGCMDELDKALEELARAEQRVKEIELEMLRTGKRGVQAELARRTGKSREYFRLLAREHGM